MSDLVGNPEDRFSHNEAQMMSVVKMVDMNAQYLSEGKMDINLIHALSLKCVKEKL